MDGVPTKILLATDGTEDATHASQSAIDLSEKGGFELREASQKRSNARRTRLHCSRALRARSAFLAERQVALAARCLSSEELLNLRFLFLLGVFVRVILGSRSQRLAKSRRGSGRSSFGPSSSCPYSPKCSMTLAEPPRSHENELPPRLISHQCVEGKFSEVHIQDAVFPHSLDGLSGVLAV
jgi:hypothetical protein